MSVWACMDIKNSPDQEEQEEIKSTKVCLSLLNTQKLCYWGCGGNVIELPAAMLDVLRVKAQLKELRGCHSNVCFCVTV